MFSLKSLSHESVAGALSKAERYRLLNEPAEAESICLDVLDIEPGNQQALIGLVLALSDQIPHDTQAFHNAITAANRLTGRYESAYYSGIVWERRAKARFHTGGRGVHHTVYDWMMEALKLFGKAEELRPHGNDDALLRWNTCVRFLQRHPVLAPQGEEEREVIVSE